MPAPISPPANPDMKEEERGAIDGAVAPPRPGEGVGAEGVIVRCIGCAVVGAVRVAGGGELVMLPLLPMELLLPARA
jgi:hypothetical protein